MAIRRSTYGRTYFSLLGLCASLVLIAIVLGNRVGYLTNPVSRHVQSRGLYHSSMPGTSGNEWLGRRPGSIYVHKALEYPLRNSSKNMPIQLGTFVYMVMGAEYPESQHVKRSCLPNSMLLFLSYNASINITQVKGVCRAVSVFEPKSTWTTGRNRLREEAFRVEEQQGWKFEFFIFMDNDVVLVQNPATHRSKVYRGDLEPDEQLRQLLLRDRPLRATVKYGKVPIKPYVNTKEPCIVSCFFDTIVEAYHRTAVDFVLPYDSRLDNVSWAMSAYMINARFAVAFPQYCTIYTQLNVDLSFVQHSSYPRADFDDPIFPESLTMIRHELSEHHVPGFPWGMRSKAFKDLIDPFLRGDDVHRPCVRNAPGVDYSKDVYSPIFHYWLQSQ